MGIEYTSKDACNERGKNYDGRFQRTDERLSNVEDTADALKEISDKLTTIIETHNEKLESHENRLTQLEKKPSIFLGHIISSILGVLGGAIGSGILNMLSMLPK